MRLVLGVQARADRNPNQTRLLGDLTHNRTLGRLARHDPAGRDLGAGLRRTRLLEDKQLATTPPLTNDVGRDALTPDSSF